MSRLKVLMITRLVDQYDSRVGFVHNWIERIAERVEELFVICLEEGRHNFKESVIVCSMGKEKGISKPHQVFRFQQAILKVIRQVDIVFCHMNPVYAIMASPYTKLLNVPLVMWYCHGNVSKTLRVAVTLVNRIVTANEESVNLKSSKILPIGHGISTSKFFLMNEANKPNKIILSVGRITPIKRLEDLIVATSILVSEYQFHDIRIQIIGAPARPDDFQYFSKLKNLTKKLSIDGYVDFLGPVSHSKVVSSYEHCALFVNLSDTNSIDKAVLEAMSCQKIVITSNTAFSTVLQNDFSNLRVPKHDPKALASRIAQILSLSQDRKILIGRELRKIVLRDHSLNRFVRRLVGVLERTLQ